jgi:hypothetical protein
MTKMEDKYNFIVATEYKPWKVFTCPTKSTQDDKGLKDNKFVKYLDRERYSSILLGDAIISIKPRDDPSFYNFVQHGKRNVLYCLVRTIGDTANIEFSVVTPRPLFLDIVSDFGSITSLVSPGSVNRITKLKRDGVYQSFAVSATSTDVSMIMSAKNGWKDHCKPTRIVLTMYEALSVIPRYIEPPPPYSIASAPEEDICCDGGHETYSHGRIITGTDSGQRVTPDISYIRGKKLAITTIIVLTLKCKV